MALTPDLRVLCRRLATTSPDDLPRVCPSLMNQAIRCRDQLSAPPEPKGNEAASETSRLVHKLRTHVSSLLNGKSPGGRFAAAVLVKTIIDVGGWECLRLSEPWVQGLISIIRKPGPAATKDLAVVTVTKIYSELRGYQTLTREIATPTVASFAEFCLQIVKPTAPGRISRPPNYLIEAIMNALATIIPLYPTTLRPFNSQVREASRICIAPTSSDDQVWPDSLQNAARRLRISLHQTAPKDGSSDDWLRALFGTIDDCHATADQVFRAVQESWESSVGINQQHVSPDAEPAGGGSAAEELPPWSGVIAGAERLVGLLDFVAAHLLCSTKGPVTIPVAAVIDLISRISLVMSPVPGQDDRFQANPAIGRDERDQLWSVLPEIHGAASRVIRAIMQRFGRSVLPVSSDVLNISIRIFRTTKQTSQGRAAAFILTRAILLIAGPTLDRMAVESLSPVIHGCCRDLLEAAGHGQDVRNDPASKINGTKKGSAIGNADAFLAPRGKTSAVAISGYQSHVHAASELLPILFSQLSQKQLTPESRGLIDRTAILCRDKEAMLASCLFPYMDKNGRYYPSILPFLVRQFPGDMDVEVLRGSLRATGGTGAAEAWDPREGLDALLEETVDDRQLPPLTGSGEQTQSGDQNQPGPQGWFGEQGRLGMRNQIQKEDAKSMLEHLPSPVAHDIKMDVDNTTNEPRSGVTVLNNDQTGGDIVWVVQPAPDQDMISSLKRKGGEIDSGASKRLEKGKGVATTMPTAPVTATNYEQDSDSDSGRSIQIDMTFDDDDDEEEEEGAANDDGAGRDHVEAGSESDA